MASLSADQAAYRDQVVAATGLDARLVTAWIACESGWGVTKAGHNYLNIGPGRTYPDVASAARDVTTVLNNGLYGGVLASVGQGPAAQRDALKASPWDAGRYANGCLDQVLDDLTGGAGATATLAAAPAATLAGGGLLDPVTKFFADALDLNDIFGQVLAVLTTGVFLAAAFGIIVLGLNRLTANSSMRRRIEQTGQQAAQAAALAAV